MSTIPAPAYQHSIEETVWIRLMRVYQQIDKHSAEIMKRHGLSVSRFDVLVHAGSKEGRTQQELADAMFVTKGNITQLLDGMEAEGLLYRRRRGRMNHIFLTDDGRCRRQAAMADQQEAVNLAIGVLEAEEKAQLSKLLRKIDRSISDTTIWEGK